MSMLNDIQNADTVTQDAVRDLMDALCQHLALREGELYTLRRGLLHHVATRDDDSALRRVRIMKMPMNRLIT